MLESSRRKGARALEAAASGSRISNNDPLNPLDLIKISNELLSMLPTISKAADGSSPTAATEITEILAVSEELLNIARTIMQPHKPTTGRGTAV